MEIKSKKLKWSYFFLPFSARRSFVADAVSVTLDVPYSNRCTNHKLPETLVKLLNGIKIMHLISIVLFFPITILVYKLCVCLGCPKSNKNNYLLTSLKLIEFFVIMPCFGVLHIFLLLQGEKVAEQNPTKKPVFRFTAFNNKFCPFFFHLMSIAIL